MTEQVDRSDGNQRTGRILARLFDVLFSVFALVVTAPVLLTCMMAIKLSSPGPVIFRQPRVGKNGQLFVCYKIRSMDAAEGFSVEQCEQAGSGWPGRFIRKTDLDEVPQFFNVLKGDMSVVGPRPHTIEDTERFARMTDQYDARHAVKPGITGWAQVNGWRGTIDSVEKISKRLEYDRWYIENRSFLLDLKIVFLTVFSKKARA